MFGRGIAAFTMLAVALVSPVRALAGGAIFYEIGTQDVGLAAAGYAARAQDPSTLFKNPAGMSLLDGTQLEVAGQLLYGNLRFTPNAGTTVQGENSGNAAGLIPGGSFFYTHSLSKDVTLGFGIFSYFGASLNYNTNWVGRYYVQDDLLAGISFMPAVSYRVKDWLSIGAGLNLMLGLLNQTAAINNVLPLGIGDGQVKVKDQTVGAGVDLGLLIEPKKGTRFGVTYLSAVRLAFSDTPSFSNLGTIGGNLQARGLLGGSVDLGLNVPQSVMVSAYHELNGQWAIMGNFGWQDWSQFGKVNVSVTTPIPDSLTVNENYQDTYHVAIGGQFRATPAWTLQSGFAYDTAAVTHATRTVTFPVGDTYRFGVGTQYQANPNLLIGFSYEFAWVGDLSVNQFRGPLAGTVSGSYNSTNLNFFALNFTWTL